MVIGESFTESKCEFEFEFEPEPEFEFGLEPEPDPEPEPVGNKTAPELDEWFGEPIWRVPLCIAGTGGVDEMSGV